MPTLLEVPPGTRPTEKELLLRWPTKTNEVEGFLTTSHLTNSYIKVWIWILAPQEPSPRTNWRYTIFFSGILSVHARLRKRETVRTVREKKRSYSRAKTAPKTVFVFVSVSVHGKGGPKNEIKIVSDFCNSESNRYLRATISNTPDNETFRCLRPSPWLLSWGVAGGRHGCLTPS